MYWKDRLNNQTKEELIDRITSLTDKTENQSKQLKQQQTAIVKYKLKLRAYELRLEKTLPKPIKEKQKLNQYEALMLKYRTEIGDLKEEIDSWRGRYLVCLEKLSKLLG